MTVVLSFDPGLVTGMAWYAAGKFHSAEWTRQETAAHIAEFVQRSDYVACERYVITEKTAKLTQQTDALGVTGAVEDACSLFGKPLKMQTMNDAKTFSKDNKLKALGWYVKTKDGHANDAARHLLLFLVRNKLLSTDDQIKLKSVFT